ncbi:phospholipase D-like domain-containing protein [Polaribacter sp. KT 15]|uniref:phospholipase D-like domain-containing protein n=1 Tax=Polaribacter sp. KT 15 TaxID=1896175 RepID=UPI000909D8F3|nr:phospholipase D-like domain-containing protein [Polaribacter sp. KT 15]SHM80446.1 PLD-like domain-containing protein [Polaribacter sp. KT 15]
MIKTIHENWLEEFNSELKNTKTICIVSPFITDNMVKHLIDNFKGKSIKVITRFDLNDFRKGVSSLTAIESLLKNKAQIKGVMGLHSKLYIFDFKSVIITSANFTNGGFFNNKEFGILSDESRTIEESYSYFKDLWKIDSGILNQNQINEWRDTIANSKPLPKTSEALPDYGVSYQKSIIGKRRYFIKFFGKGDNRLTLNHKITDELKGGCSHFALSFSRAKNDARPRRYKNGDVVFMARMTKEPNDYVIFGRAISYTHDKNRDIASKEDIKHIPWLKEWPILVRVKNPVFIDSIYGNCPKLFNLIEELDYDSFASTRIKYDKGIRNINPKNTLMRKGDVILSESGAQWMELAFKKAIEQEGEVEKTLIAKLYQGQKIF